MMMPGQSIHNLFLSLCLCVAPAFTQTRLRPPEIGKPAERELSGLLPTAASLRSPGRSLDTSQQCAKKSPRQPDGAVDDKDVRPLEQGHTVKRELSGAQRHIYRLRLGAAQFLKATIEQQGIDVVAQVSEADGAQILEFDSEIRLQGQEQVSLVAEAAGDYQLVVQPKQKQAAAGSYEIRIEELRAATDNDRALQEAHKLSQESFKLFGVGKYNEALPLVQRVLEIRERILGPDNRGVATALNRLAILYAIKGEYAKAEPLYQRALLTMEKALGPDHPDVASSLNALAILYRSRGDYAKAEQLYLRALLIWEKALGPDSSYVANALFNLANLYLIKDDYAKAEPLYLRALTIREKTLGPDHPDIASSLNSLAALYREKGAHAKAEPLYLRALNIREKALRPDHSDVAMSLNNLALFYSDKGDYVKAEPLFQRALNIKEKALGPDHPDVAFSLEGLAIIYRNKGDYVKAESLFQRALNIKEKAFGLDHQDTASLLNSLALIYVAKGDYAKAEPLFERALLTWEKALGPDSPKLANALNNLANLYTIKGDYTMAEPLFERALAIKEKVLGPEHKDIAVIFYSLAGLYSAKGDFDQAVKVQSHANSISERNLALNLATGSERQKLAYLALFSRQTDFTLWLHSHVAPNDPQALSLAFTTLLRRKGRGLDVMANTIAALRRRAAPQDQELFDQLAEARSQLATLILRESDSAKPETYRTRIKPLEERVENLEAELSARSVEFRAQAQPVTLSAVQSAIPADSVLIEFVTYTPQDPRIDESQPPRYLAYLLEPRGQPKWVDLGAAAPIERAVDAWRQSLRDPRRTDVKRLARVVDEKVMRPVLALTQSGFGAPCRLLIAPDGLLNLVPFAAFVDRQGRYLVERYSISYLMSGRDLLRSPVRGPNNQDTVIVANPDYDAAGEAVAVRSRDVGLSPASFGDWRIWLPGFVARSRGVGLPAALPKSAGSKSNLTQVYFPPLKGTADEARALKTILPQATVFTGGQATEDALKQLHSPGILHVATHGFFLRDQEIRLVGSRALILDTSQPVASSDRPIENPLLRSGLALAGVNQRLGRADQGDDGVLTALEAAGLDLWGTKLVVLSACDTGVGEVRNGEGVFGLRRALSLAGSETQVMSLWPVSDLGARDLMIEYYKGLGRGDGRGDGLRQVQLRMLRGRDRNHPFYWAAFIQSGEWANLEGSPARGRAQSTVP